MSSQSARILFGETDEAKIAEHLREMQTMLENPELLRDMVQHMKDPSNDDDSEYRAALEELATNLAKVDDEMRDADQLTAAIRATPGGAELRRQFTAALVQELREAGVLPAE